MKKMKSKSKLSILKYNAYKLRAYYQIPYQLMKLIEDCTSDTDDRILAFLMRESEHYLRVRGYYKKYPSIEELCDKQLADAYANLVCKLYDTN